MRRRGLESPPAKCGPGPQPGRAVVRSVLCVQRPMRPRIWTGWTLWTIWILSRPRTVEFHLRKVYAKLGIRGDPARRVARDAAAGDLHDVIEVAVVDDVDQASDEGRVVLGGVHGDASSTMPRRIRRSNSRAAPLAAGGERSDACCELELLRANPS